MVPVLWQRWCRGRIHDYSNIHSLSYWPISSFGEKSLGLGSHLDRIELVKDGQYIGCEPPVGTWLDHLFQWLFVSQRIIHSSPLKVCKHHKKLFLEVSIITFLHIGLPVFEQLSRWMEINKWREQNDDGFSQVIPSVATGFPLIDCMLYHQGFAEAVLPWYHHHHHRQWWKQVGLRFSNESMFVLVVLLSFSEGSRSWLPLHCIGAWHYYVRRASLIAHLVGLAQLVLVLGWRVSHGQGKCIGVRLQSEGHLLFQNKAFLQKKCAKSILELLPQYIIGWGNAILTIRTMGPFLALAIWQAGHLSSLFSSSPLLGLPPFWFSLLLCDCCIGVSWSSVGPRMWCWMAEIWTFKLSANWRHWLPTSCATRSGKMVHRRASRAWSHWGVREARVAWTCSITADGRDWLSGEDEFPGDGGLMEGDWLDKEDEFPGDGGSTEEDLKWVNRSGSTYLTAFG